MNRASRYLANVKVLTFVRAVIVGVIVCICYHATPSDGKVFERCELAQLLRYGHGLDVNDVANWVCIAQHSSSLNSSAFGGDARSGSHGLFQISDQYWCSPPGKGVACGVTCDMLRDDDIGDDLECIRAIYQEHQRLSGDGYNAWNAYQPYCRENPYEYVEDCFGNEEREYLHSKSITANYVEDEEEEEEENDYDPYSSKKRGKVYGRCELAKELFLKHKMPMEEIPTWVCIAQHESNYDTSAVGRLNTDGSADHGLFQISDLYWCSHKGGRRKACGLPCSKLLDSDITDDVKCVKQIYKEHTRISGDGFTAWTVYNAYCHDKTANYIRGCFDGIDVQDSGASEEYRKPSKPSRGNKHQKPHGKVYDPCELAEELRSKFQMPEDQIATWVCIAKHESDYNTSAVGFGDHGLFQISDIYWCSPPGKGWACGLSCADLEDSDISDDVECIRKIYAEHTHLSGDGFNAWTVYPRYCSEGRSESYISHCSGSYPKPAVTSPPHTYSKLTNPNSIEDEDYQSKRGKIYGRCELAKELLTKYEMSMDEIPIWVCIAQHESNYDTSAVGRLNTDGSADHGLFQISDLYWCSHKDGHRKACGLPCSKLLDNDIADDIKCVKQIHNEHTRISGDGFTAWTVYNAYCKERTEQYIQGCFDGSAPVEDFNPRAVDYGYIPKNKPKGKVYEECELAIELRDRYNIPKEQISTWVCIAKHQSGLNTSSSFSDVHGMFHISDEYWCSPPGKGKVCELACSDLEDSDISDDVDCIRKIYLEHQRLFGNGFSAWVVYPQHCSNGRADDYVGHCPGFEAPRTNQIAYGTPRLISPSNKPVYNHVFSENPFLKHVELVNSDAASKFLSEPIEESLSASDEVDTVVPANHEFSLNPFLKHIKLEQVKPTEVPMESTTPPPAFLGIPIAPTPTKTTRLQTYQPQNEERAKYEAFKAFATPSLPLTPQTPRANRLQAYQLNTYNGLRTFASPTLPTVQAPTSSNRLQPYQLNTFNSFTTTTTPTTQPVTTKIPTMKPLPTVQLKSSTKPYTFNSFMTNVRLAPASIKPVPTVQPKSPTFTRTSLTQVSQDSGQYDPSRYDSGRYDAGRYDPGRYNPPKSQATSNTNPKTEAKSAILSSGQYPTPTLQSKTPPTSIKIISTVLSSSKPFATSTRITDQLSSTRFPSISTNSRRYEPLKAIPTNTLTAKTPTTKVDTFKAFSTTLKPTTTFVTSSKKFEAYKAVNSGKYIPYKPPSTSTETGKYIQNKSLSTPSLPTNVKLNLGIRTTTTASPTKKFDPFKPFGSTSTSYDPFKVFNTGHQQSSTFSFLSAKDASSNELDFKQSSNSKRETETLRTQASASRTSTGDLTTSLTSKRETKSEEKPAVITSTHQQKSAISSTPAESSVKSQVPATPIRSGVITSSTKSTTQTTRTPARSVAKTSPERSGTQTRSANTIRVTKPTAINASKPETSASSAAKTSSERSSTQTRSANTTRSAKPTAIIAPKQETLVRSVPGSIPTRSVSTTSTVTTKPSRSVVSQLSATPTKSSEKLTRSASTTSTVTTKPSHSIISQLSATPKKSPERSTRSVTTSGINKSADTSEPTSSISEQFSETRTKSVSSSSATRLIITSATAKPGYTIRVTKPTTINASKPETSAGSAAKTSSEISSTKTRSANTTRSAKPTAIIAPKQETSVISVPGSIPTRSVNTTSAVTTKPSRSVVSQLSATPTRSSEKLTRSVSTTSTVTTKPSHSIISQLSATPKKSSERSTRSVTTSGTSKSADTSAPISSVSAQFSATRTKSVSSSAATRSIITSATAKSGYIVTSKPTLSAHRQYTATPTRSVATSTSTRLPISSTSTVPPTRSTRTSSLSKTTIKTNATVTSLVPTRTESEKSLNPSKVTVTSAISPTRSTTTTTSKKPSTTSRVISPTKSHRSSESLYSSRLNIFDLYYKLYGVHPPIRTSSGVDEETKTSQTNVASSRTS